MGLLDLEDPQRLGLLSLGLRLMSTPGRFGQALGTAGMGALGDMQSAKQAQMRSQLLKAQMDELQAQAAQRQAQAEEIKRKQAESERIRALVQNSVAPVSGIEANAVSGIPGPRPEALRVVGQRKPIDYQGLVAAGVPADLVEKLAASSNYGKSKVARTVDVEGPNGEKLVQAYDEFNNKVGDPVPAYIAPVPVNQGDKVTFNKPRAGLSLPVGMSPSERDASARGWANVGIGKEANRIKEKEVGLIGGKETFKAATDVRKEFEDRTEVKNFRQAMPVLDAARNAPDTTQGDLQLIYAVGKVLDPNSVVREGEMSLVIKSGSPAERVEGFTRYLLGGGRLTPSARKKLITALESRTNEYQRDYNETRKNYEALAKQRGLDPAEVFMNDRPPTGAGVIDFGSLK